MRSLWKGYSEDIVMPQEAAQDHNLSAYERYIAHLKETGHMGFFDKPLNEQ